MESQLWRVLLIEDDEDDYVLTRTMLSIAKGEHVELIWAQSYEDAIKILDERTLDVILVDQYLGPHTGIDLVREAIANGCETPFILLTGDGSYELDVEAANAGATDYLVKGEVTSPLLERAIRYAISRNRAEQEINRSVEHIEMQHHLIQQRELERLQIAQDLHDGPLQELIGMSLMLREAMSIPSDQIDSTQEIKSKAERVLKVLQSQIHGIRSFCSELRPPALAPYGLEKAIRSHIEAFREKHPDIKIHLDLAPDGQKLHEDTRLALYRIYQELMNNITRHSGASEVWITLTLTERQVRLVVRDNGKGFDVPWNWVEVARQGHLGLVGIRERADMAGGTVTIHSKPGEGTTVDITTPLHPVYRPILNRNYPEKASNPNL